MVAQNRIIRGWVQLQAELADAAERVRGDAGEQGDGVFVQGGKCGAWRTEQPDVVSGCGEGESESAVSVVERQALCAEAGRSESQWGLMREAWQNWEGVHVLGGDHAAQLSGQVEELGELGLIVGLLQSSDQIYLVAAASWEFDAAPLEKAFELLDLAVLVIEKAAVFAIAAVETGRPVCVVASHAVSVGRAASDCPVLMVSSSRPFTYVQRHKPTLPCFECHCCRAIDVCGGKRSLDFFQDL
jgi:hypothetical protein